jgi:YbbR domain-containing protein
MNNQRSGYELPGFVRRWGASAPGNLMLGIVSIALAIVIWVAVTIHENPKEPEDWEVRADARNVPSKYIVSIDPQKVKVRFRIPRSMKGDYQPDADARGEVDLSHVEEEANGREEFVVERPVHIISGHRDVEVEPLATVKVTVELAQTKTVPVQVKTSGIPQLGYVAEASPPGAPEAIIRGTKGSLKLVEYVTADVKLDGLTVSVDHNVSLQPRNRDGQPAGGVTVQPEDTTVRVKVTQVLFERQVPVDIRVRGQPKLGYRLTSMTADPVLVKVSGPLDIINSISSIPTDDVDIEGAVQDVKRFVRLRPPLNVTTSTQTVTATVGLLAVRASAPVSVVPRVSNLGVNLTASLVTPIVAITLSGPLGDLAQLRATDVSVIVNVAGLGPGTHRVEPQIFVPPNLQQESIVPEKVEVVITPAR